MSDGVSQNKFSSFGEVSKTEILKKKELKKSTVLISGNDLNKSIFVPATSKTIVIRL
jgi:hypothetical protein